VKCLRCRIDSCMRKPDWHSNSETGCASGSHRPSERALRSVSRSLQSLTDHGVDGDPPGYPGIPRPR
jgi:hypothetical protein